LQIKTKIVSCHKADSKLVKQEVNGTLILPPLVLPVYNQCVAAASSALFKVSWTNKVNSLLKFDGYGLASTISNVAEHLKTVNNI
jgi:hypothetical protein